MFSFPKKLKFLSNLSVGLYRGIGAMADGELFGLGKFFAVEYSRLAEHQIFDSFLMFILIRE